LLEIEQVNSGTGRMRTCGQLLNLLQNWLEPHLDEKTTADPNNVRVMKIETDLEHVCQIWLSGIAETAPSLSPGESWDSRRPSFEEEARNADNNKYVYEEDGNIKGFVIAGILNGTHYIYELYVHSDFRGEGIGTELLDEIRKTYRCLNSHVYECNPYLEFYLKNDFQVSGKKECPDTGQIKLEITWQSGEKRL
jgi:GNAT superfamily N-acetyltransferase